MHSTTSFERALATRSSGEWLVALEAAGIPCGPLNDVAAVVADPHVQARHMIVDIDDERVQPLRAGRQPDQVVGVRRPRGPSIRPRPRRAPRRIAARLGLA